MTLLDAPAYNARRARLIHRLSITAVVLVVMAGIGTWLWYLQVPWQLWHWPADHKINRFLDTVQQGDLKKAYGIWNNDPNWEQHPQEYQLYNFAQFSKDWGASSDYGVIKSHTIIVAHHVGNGVIIGVDINGGKTPIFLRVDGPTGTIGFSPIELYYGPS